MNLKPLYEKIVVKLDDKQETESDAGIIIQTDFSTNKHTVLKAKVVAVGDGRLLQDGTVIPLKVKVGDIVLFSKIQGESYNDGNDDYTILSESNILAIIEKESKCYDENYKC